ncbi:hypothetical protein KCH_21450 [Kitasatospora cheerisanensis KCTC 2395]|uniref:Uncharacterized protein n=1 Tax=Kitasatospora cheerisanensis KCTC 2395 TaxID=1348663 RepID=A0A066YXQ2_9ACTN|nr:hypothetical protein KCH_21450 [Kitasatospora cheerisanensis KCTC 2395]
MGTWRADDPLRCRGKSRSSLRGREYDTRGPVGRPVRQCAAYGAAGARTGVSGVPAWPCS